MPAVLRAALPAVLPAVVIAVWSRLTCQLCVGDWAFQSSHFQLNMSCFVRDTTGSDPSTVLSKLTWNDWKAWV